MRIFLATLFIFFCHFSQAMIINTGFEPVFGVQAGMYVYVANQDSNTVTVIDTEKNTPIMHIKVGLRPISMVATSKYIYVNNSTSNTVTVIDHQKNQVSTTIKVDNGAYYSYTYDKYVYVLGRGYVTVIDADARKIVTTIELQSDIQQRNNAVIDTTRKKLYIPHSSSNSISVINLQNNTQEEPISIDSPSVMVQDAETLYVLDNRNFRIRAIDLTQKKVKTDFNIGLVRKPQKLYLIRNKFYAIHSLDANISVIDISQKKIIKTIEMIGKNKPYVGVYEGFLFLMNSEKNSLDFIDSTVDTVAYSIPNYFIPSHIIFTQKYGYIIATKDNIVSIIDVARPQLLGFATEAPTGIYAEDQDISITAIFSDEIRPDSSLEIELSNQEKVRLKYLDNRTLSGVYSIKKGDDTKNLFVKDIVSSEIAHSGSLPGKAYTVLSNNLSSQKISIVTNTADPLCEPYRKCPFKAEESDFVGLQDQLVCEGFIRTDKTRKNTHATRLETLDLAIKMLKRNMSGHEQYNSTFSDVKASSENIALISSVQTGLDYDLLPVESGDFRADEQVTRVEAYHMLMKSVCMAPETYGAVGWVRLVYQTAYSEGITNKSWFNFGPFMFVQKQELYNVALRMANWAQQTGGCQKYMCELEKK